MYSSRCVHQTHADYGAECGQLLSERCANPADRCGFALVRAVSLRAEKTGNEDRRQKTGEDGISTRHQTASVNLADAPAQPTAKRRRLARVLRRAGYCDPATPAASWGEPDGRTGPQPQPPATPVSVLRCSRKLRIDVRRSILWMC